MTLGLMKEILNLLTQVKMYRIKAECSPSFKSLKLISARLPRSFKKANYYSQSLRHF